MTDTFTQHFFERAGQRGIDYLAIQAAINFGQVVYAKNSKYFFLGNRAMNKLLKVFRPHNPDKWQGIVVVFDTRKEMFVTCFKNRNWLKKIRHKK